MPCILFQKDAPGNAGGLGRPGVMVRWRRPSAWFGRRSTAAHFSNADPATVKALSGHTPNCVKACGRLLPAGSLMLCGGYLVRTYAQKRCRVTREAALRDATELLRGRIPRLLRVHCCDYKPSAVYLRSLEIRQASPHRRSLYRKGELQFCCHQERLRCSGRS